MERCRLDQAGVFQVESIDRTRGSGTKSKYKEFQLNIRKSYTVRMVKHFHRLPREVVGSAALVVLKSHLDMVLSSLCRCPWLSRGAGQGDLQRSLGCSAVLSFCVQMCCSCWKTALRGTAWGDWNTRDLLTQKKLVEHWLQFSQDCVINADGS